MRPSRRNFVKLTSAVAGGGIAAYTLSEHAGTLDESGSKGARTSDTDRPADLTKLGERDGVFYVAPDEGLDGIQSVIDAAAPNATVVLGRGTYVGSRLTLRNDVRLRGLGPNATTLRLADGADTHLVVSPNPEQQVSMRVRMENITLDGNNRNNSAGDVVYGAFWNSRFVNCTFVDAPEHGFWLAGSPNGSTDDNLFRNCRFVRSGETGLRVGASRDVGAAVGVTRVETCWFGKNEDDAVRIRGNGNFVTSGKFYRNTGCDVLIDRGSRNAILNNDMSKPSPSDPCISLWSRKGVDSSNNRIAGNVLFGSFPDGVFCHADGNSIRALQVHDNVIDGTDAGNRSAIYAVGDEFVGCSARDNTASGEFAGAPIQVPDTWATSGNIT